MDFQLISVERADNDYVFESVVIKVMKLKPMEVHNWVMLESVYLEKELYITSNLYKYLKSRFDEV